MKKKFLLALIVMAVGISLFGVINVSAATIDRGSCGNSVSWTLDSNGVLTIKGTGSMTNYTYFSPAPWHKYESSKKINKVIIENGVTTIGDYAFYNCSITNIEIPNSVNEIGVASFEYCNDLHTLYIPEGVETIRTNAFDGSNIETIYLPQSLKKIWYSAFYNCESLEDVYITDLSAWLNITYPEYSSLYQLDYMTAHPMYYADNLYLNNELIKHLVIPLGTESIDDLAFYGCSSIEDISLPNTVIDVGENAFHNTGWYAKQSDGPLYIDSVLYGWKGGMTENYDFYVKEGIEVISDTAFKNLVNIKSIFIPKTVKQLSEKSFKGCANLEKIEIDNENDYYCSSNGVLFNKEMSILIKYPIGKKENEYIIPNGVKTIGENAFYSDYTRICKFQFTELLIPNSVVSIEKDAFRYNTDVYNSKQNVIYYNGNQISWNNLIANSESAYFDEATIKFISYVTIYDENGFLLNQKKYENGAYITTDILQAKEGYTGKFYTDAVCSLEYDYNQPILENFDVFLKYIINQYSYKFLDEDGVILKEKTIDYGSIIIPPEVPYKTEYYVFDYWKDYNDGLTITNDVTFKAVFKYRDYSINAEGLPETVNVTYNSNFTIEPQKIDNYHYFIGYFTEKNGKGTQITNEKGESLSVYNVIGDLTVYPYFYEGYINKIELQGKTFAMPGDTITQSAIFATDKNAAYFIATVKYPKYLNCKSIKGIDFEEATIDSEKVVGDYKYLDITCVFDYEGNFVEISTNYIPFEIEFDISTDIPKNKLNMAYEISVEKVMLIGDDYYEITDIKNHTLTILPKLAESIEIIGNEEFDKATQFITVVSPDYTTDKSVVWSVNDETVATITKDGTVTPIKNGTVVITATAKDGSEIFATKIVDVIAYAKIDSLDFGGGVVLTEFNPDIRQYTVYVQENVTSISLTPTFSGGGVLRPNGSGIWVSGRSKDFELNDIENTITLNRENVTDMTNSVYTVEVIKFEGTKTGVSEDKKSFTITPINVETGKTVILALYSEDVFVEMQRAVYTGDAIHFTTTKTYTIAKVMVWEDFCNLKPLSKVEEILITQ